MKWTYRKSKMDELKKILEDEEDYFDSVVAYILCKQYNAKYTMYKRPCRTGPLSGHHFVEELIHGHELRSYQSFRMHPPVFFRLRDILKERGLIKDTMNVSCTEQLAICLSVLALGTPNHQLAERFQHSGETISRHFNIVLRAIVTLKRDYIKLPESNRVPDRIRTNKNFYPAFKVVSFIYSILE